MGNQHRAEGRPEALILTAPLDRLPVPIHVRTGETVDIARVWEPHWAAQRDAAGRVVRPGFELAVHGRGRIKRELGAEILELQEALSAAHTDSMLTQAPDLQSPIERAQFVVSELLRLHETNRGPARNHRRERATARCVHTTPD